MKPKKKKRIEIIKTNSERHMVITPIFRVSFPQVFTPKAFEDNEKKSFQIDMIFDEADLKLPYNGKKIQTVSMKKAVLNAKVDQWGEDKSQWPTFTYPVFKDGNERTNDEGVIYQGYEGKIYVTAKANEDKKPRILDKYGKVITDEAEIYGGCYARAQLLARPYASGKNQGVSFKLLQLIKQKDGDKFGGFTSDVFDVEDAAEDNWDDDGDEYDY